jgi:SpoU rRNA methylase family enzyme
VKALGGIGVAVVLAMGIAMSISWISGLDRSVVTPSGEPMVIFSDHRTRPITKETIVDELVALRLSSHIHRVAIETTVLEIDLMVEAGRANRVVVESDMGELARLAIAESDNIGRVFIRVLEKNESSSGGKLLLALTGGKTEFSEQELQRLRDGERMPSEWMAERMRFMQTERWRDIAQ